MPFRHPADEGFDSAQGCRPRHARRPPPLRRADPGAGRHGNAMPLGNETGMTAEERRNLAPGCRSSDGACQTMSTPPPMGIDEVNHLDATSFSVLLRRCRRAFALGGGKRGHARPFADRRRDGRRPSSTPSCGTARRSACLDPRPSRPCRPRRDRRRTDRDSKREQAGAGLDRLTAEEFARFTELNSSTGSSTAFPSSSRSRARPSTRSSTPSKSG